MTYANHLREAMRRDKVPIAFAEHAISATLEIMPWLDEEFVPPDLPHRLEVAWGYVKLCATESFRESGYTETPWGSLL